MRRDEDGALWLTPREWIGNWHQTGQALSPDKLTAGASPRVRTMANHPERIVDASPPAPDAKDPHDADRAERAEAKQWRAGRAQGVLARTSPVANERRRKEPERT